MSLKLIKKDFIRKIVCEWYGVLGMPMRILTREEEVEEFETAHPEVPPFMWEFVNHKARLALRWAKDTDVDIIVRDGDRYVLVQEMFFRGNYDSDKDWKAEVMEWISHCEEVWVVYHGEVCRD